MTQRDRTELVRLAAELGADLASLDEMAAALEPWMRREAAPEESLIPAGWLHHFYTGIEAFLVRLAVGIEGSEPSGPDSHARLLSLAAIEVPGVRPAWLTAEQVAELRELLAFRHFFRHGYAAKYRALRLRELATLAIGAWPSVRASLAKSKDWLERLAQTPN